MSSFGPSVVSPTQAMSQQASPSPTSQSHPNAEGSVYAHQKWNVASQQPQLYLARLPPVAPASDSNSARSIQSGVPRPKRKRITPEQLEVLSNLFEYVSLTRRPSSQFSSHGVVHFHPPPLAVYIHNLMPWGLVSANIEILKITDISMNFDPDLQDWHANVWSKRSHWC